MPQPMNKPLLQRSDLLKPGTRTINMTTIGDDLLRESSAAFGPRVEALVVSGDRGAWYSPGMAAALSRGTA